MPSVIRRGWNWCKRFRHRKGYGVHSPADFYFITFVVYERSAYYAYLPLDEQRKKASSLPSYREKTDKLLLRLTNYLQPDAVWEIGTGNGTDACYLAAGKSCPLLTIDEDSEEADAVSATLATYPQITYRRGDIIGLLEEHLAQSALPQLVHLAHTDRYRECFERILPHVSSDTCLIVSHPHADAGKLKWWKAVTTDTRTGITFDLYDIGIIFFDHKRVKQNRIVNFL